jgi:hypothetical protein
MRLSVRKPQRDGQLRVEFQQRAARLAEEAQEFAESYLPWPSAMFEATETAPV